MKQTSSPSTAVIVLVAIAAVAALAGGLVGGSEETHYTPSHEYVAEDHPVGEAVVVSKSQRGEFGIFGITIRQPEHFIRLTFTLPQTCDIGDAELWPIADPSCTGPAGLTGSIAGTGRTAAGEPLVTVEIPVDADCYAADELGTIWPTPLAACVAVR